MMGRKKATLNGKKENVGSAPDLARGGSGEKQEE